MWQVWETVLRSLLVTTWFAVAQKFLVAERSIGNRSGPRGPLGKDQNVYLQALSAFIKIGKTVLRSLQVPTSLLKIFWLLTGPSGTGFAHLDRWQSSKYLPPAFKCLRILRERSSGLYRFPSGYSKSFYLLADRSIGNQSGPPGTAG
jgi:hypothetical protein